MERFFWVVRNKKEVPIYQFQKIGRYFVCVDYDNRCVYQELDNGVDTKNFVINTIKLLKKQINNN
jgi:hypothetical protein